jgi:hypothetical protein
MGERSKRILPGIAPGSAVGGEKGGSFPLEGGACSSLFFRFSSPSACIG